LTQLVLGVDRDSVRIADLFDERNEAVKRACADLIAAAHRAGRSVGICGQAPSDYPEFAEFLVAHGIDSMSLNADALVRTKRRVWQAEQRLLPAADALVSHATAPIVYPLADAGVR
jgi:pyruvate,water dikinase